MRGEPFILPDSKPLFSQPRDKEGKRRPGTQITVPPGYTASEAAFTKSTTLETEGFKDSEELGGRDQSRGNTWSRSAPDWETQPHRVSEL